MAVVAGGGIGGMPGGKGGLAVGGGGLGLIVIVVIVLINTFSGGVSTGTRRPAGGRLRQRRREQQPAGERVPDRARTPTPTTTAPSSPSSTRCRATGPTPSPPPARTYREADTVFFSGSTPTGCGTGIAGHGPVLLPARPDGLHRPGVLGRAEDHLRRQRRARSPRPTCSPMSTAITCRICSAPATGSAPRPARRPGRCGWNCRPTATPGCGPSTPRPCRMPTARC